MDSPGENPRWPLHLFLGILVLSFVALTRNPLFIDLPRAPVRTTHPPFDIRDVSALPKHINPAAGEIALIADYQKVDSEEGEIPVYLINRSDKDLQLQAQDGDVYLKLEFRLADGTWKRAQSHRFSTCGDSYMNPPILPKQTFLRLHGHQPPFGTPANIRYKLYRQSISLVSNIGRGMVLRSEIEKASNDLLTIQEGNFDVVSNIASNSSLRALPNILEDPRHAAICELGSSRFKPEQAKLILRKIGAARDPYSPAAQRALDHLSQNANE